MVQQVLQNQHPFTWTVADDEAQEWWKIVFLNHVETFDNIDEERWKINTKWIKNSSIVTAQVKGYDEYDVLLY